MAVQPEEIVADFVKAAELAGLPPIPIADIQIAHGHPKSLPTGMLAVYVFMDGDRCIKVGMIGRRNPRRYCISHYDPLRRQGLAARLLKECYLPADGTSLSEQTVSPWLRGKTDRINFLIPEKHGIRVVALFEVFVQCKLNPEYEGRSAD